MNWVLVTRNQVDSWRPLLDALMNSKKGSPPCTYPLWRFDAWCGGVQHSMRTETPLTHLSISKLDQTSRGTSRQSSSSDAVNHPLMFLERGRGRGTGKGVSFLIMPQKPAIILGGRLVSGPVSLWIPFTAWAGGLPYQVQHINPVC